MTGSHHSAQLAAPIRSLVMFCAIRALKWVQSPVGWKAGPSGRHGDLEKKKKKKTSGGGGDKDGLDGRWIFSINLL